MNRAAPSQAPAKTDAEAQATYDIEVSKVDSRVLWRITRIAFRHPWRMASGLAATALAASFQLFVPQFLGRAVDQARGLLVEGGGIEGRAAAEAALAWTAVLLIGASLLRGLFTMVQNYQGEAAGHLIGYQLRLEYYRKLQKLSLSWHDRIHSGDLLTLGILDIEGSGCGSAPAFCAWCC